MSYQDWLANPRAQVDVVRINDVVDAITPQLAIAEVTDEYDPLAIEYDPLGLQLASGMIGMTIDHVKQLFLVVVDPAMIAIDELQRDLSAVSGELNVEVRAGCHSIEEITTARQVIRGRDWHPQVSKAAYAFHLDPATATFKVDMAEADREVGDALSEALGEMVDVTYGPAPERVGRFDDVFSGSKHESDAHEFDTRGVTFSGVRP
ncbi:MAG: hypothetical protein IIC26_01895 [Chloroflexi bacterium]|nr:hypothetical protein [Chloroflexota bacterium]